MKGIIQFFTVLFIGLTAGSAVLANTAVPVTSDSRVKTFVYNENEVYPILTQYGYQTNIELGRGEEIQTISVGDRVSWQIVPAGRRIFIQTQLDDARTNMTVVTDRRSYQFDLQSTGARSAREDELVYVARFYYPEEDWDQPQPVEVSTQLIDAPLDEEYNFNYTFSGPDAIAPVKVFDDGHSTFFQFSGSAPTIAAVTPNGQEVAVNVSQHNGYYIVNSTAGQFALRSGAQIVCVFNEARGGQAQMHGVSHGR